MRSGIILCITIISSVLMQGCGRKAPLTLPVSKPQASEIQASRAPASGSQTPDQQKSAVPSSLQGKEP